MIQKTGAWKQIQVAVNMDPPNTSDSPGGKYGNGYAPYGNNIFELAVVSFLRSDNTTTNAFSIPLKGYLDEVDDLNGSIPTPRSDFPGERYSNYIWSQDNEEWTRFSISIITTNVPRRFKDNAHKSCRMMLKSRLLTNWKDVIKTNNFPDKNKNITNYDGWEGIGEWIHSPSADNIDVSLSGDNLGVYVVDVVNVNSDGNLYYWNLEDTYWCGKYNNWEDRRAYPWGTGSRDLSYHIEKGTGDQLTYGGYNFMWHDYNAHE